MKEQFKARIEAYELKSKESKVLAEHYAKKAEAFLRLSEMDRINANNYKIQMESL